MTPFIPSWGRILGEEEEEEEELPRPSEEEEEEEEESVLSRWIIHFFIRAHTIFQLILILYYVRFTDIKSSRLEDNYLTTASLH